LKIGKIDENWLDFSLLYCVIKLAKMILIASNKSQVACADRAWEPGGLKFKPGP